jgi:hypothetical protein
VLEAVQHDGGALEFASEELRNDKVLSPLGIKTLKKDTPHSSILQPSSSSRQQEVVLAAVGQDGYSLLGATRELRGDPEVVRVAVAQAGNALRYATRELRANKEVVLTAVRQSGVALVYANEDLRRNRDVALLAVGKNEHALRYMGEELFGDVEVMRVALRLNGIALCRTPLELRADRECVLTAVTQVRTEKRGRGKAENGYVEREVLRPQPLRPPYFTHIIAPSPPSNPHTTAAIPATSFLTHIPPPQIPTQTT